MQYLHLEVSNSIYDGKSKRVTSLYEDRNQKPVEIFYEFDSVLPWSDNTLLDGHMFAVLLYASALGKPLKVHGALSHTTVRNMEELLSIWCMWQPEIYKKIEILPDRIENSRKTPSKEKAISAFSGGVDSIFTALRNTRILTENTHYPLQSILMVHGFDVDMYNNNDFTKLTQRMQPILDDLNLELRTIRTNSRELKIQNWEDSHGLEIAACLHMYSDEFDLHQVRKIKINTDGQIKELGRIVKYARKNKIDDPWVLLLEQRLYGIEPAKKLSRQNGDLVKRILKTILKALNIDEPVKRIWRQTKRTFFDI